MSSGKKVVYTVEKLRLLKLAVKRALKDGLTRDDVFIFDGDEYVVAYAEYLIGYLEQVFEEGREGGNLN